MQINELYRRGIFHAIGEKSKCELDSWNVENPIQVRLFTIPDDSSFEKLIEIGIFRKINESLDCNIDDYEEEAIAPEKLKQLAAIIKSFSKIHEKDLLAKYLLENICEVVESAIKENATVFFVL